MIVPLAALLATVTIVVTLMFMCGFGGDMGMKKAHALIDLNNDDNNNHTNIPERPRNDTAAAAAAGASDDSTVILPEPFTAHVHSSAFYMNSGGDGDDMDDKDNAIPDNQDTSFFPPGPSQIVYVKWL